MKICFLGDIGSIHIRRWIEYFRDNGNKVYVISFNNYRIEGVNVTYLGENININSSGGNINYLKKIKEIKRMIKEINPDIINAHYVTSYGFIAALIKDRPLVISTWGSDILVTPKKNFIYKLLTQYSLKKGDLITSDSNNMTKEIKKLTRNHSTVITRPMGIDPNQFNLEGTEKNREKILLSMRTLCDNSNIDIILKAFKKVLDYDKDIKLVITNSGEKENEVLQNIKALGIEKSVEFLGFISHEQVIDLLKKSFIFISIPTSDSTSVTLLEAMACGTFPIVSDIPANNEWIVNNTNGLILEDNSEEKLNRLIQCVLGNNELVKKARIENKNIIDNNAIWDDNMRDIKEYYQNLIANKLLKM